MTWDLTDDEEERLTNELREALDRVIRATACTDMGPLWLKAVERPRKDFLKKEGGITGLPDHLRRWPAPKQTKYASLAHWRHVVLSHGVLDRLPERHRRAVTDMYFTPCANVTPYSWSKASGQAPAADRYPSPSAFDVAAKAGCEGTLAIAAEHGSAPHGASVEALARAAFADLSPRMGSLRDILRLKKA